MKPKYRIVFIGYPCDSDFRTVIYKIQYGGRNLCVQDFYVVLRTVSGTPLCTEISRLLSAIGIESNEIEFVKTEVSDVKKGALDIIEKQTRFYLDYLNERRNKITVHYPKEDYI